MRFRVLACDYDGTLATAGTIAPETVDALGRARASGRRILLVTGRRLDDLCDVCARLDVFDLVVAENGAVLFDPRARRVQELAEPPAPTFTRALAQAGVPFAVGRVIVATTVPHDAVVQQVIRRFGLELQIVFNREAVMVLPSGVSKETGFLAALRELGVSARNTVAVGDAENDQPFLARAGFAVAVANAVPALAASADLVTRAAAGAGVRELIDGPLVTDLEGLRSRRRDRAVTLGRAEGRVVAHETRRRP
jgi:hypothetical protein